MKKNLLIVLSVFSVLLVWCSNNNQSNQIDPEKWLSENGVSIEETFNSQIEDFQYIKDFEDFISYNILSITEDKPFLSDFSLTAKFDKNSSIQWWIDFSQKKISKARDLESSDITFNVDAKDKENNLEPFNLSWSLSLLYEDDEAYAQVHDLWVFMWEWSVAAKMYSLLWDLIIDNWVNLEIHSWWFITINEQPNKELPHIVTTFENILKTEDVQSSPNFLWSIIEIIDTINSYKNLWISTDELKILNHEIAYFELSDKTIQKWFTWSFQWNQSAFDLSFISSKKWFKIYLYNIKEYSDDGSDFKDTDSEFIFTLNEDEKSEYSVNFVSLKSNQKTVDLQWKINYSDNTKFSADFDFEPTKILPWQKISWKLNWDITKKAWNWDETIPELTGKILLLSELLSSL